MTISGLLPGEVARTGPPTAQVVIDRHSDVVAMVRMMFAASTARSDRGFVHSFNLDATTSPTSLLPEDAIVTRCATTDFQVSVLAECATALILISASAGLAMVTVAAETEEITVRLELQIRSRVRPEPTPDTVTLRTWSTTPPRGARSATREVAAPEWSAIRRNYTSQVREQLDRLVALREPGPVGRFVLWHGEPGTGKTTALRALLREWEPWCSAHYIADPERFLEDPVYITDVLTQRSKGTSGPTLTTAAEPATPWRLLVVEDNDQYLRAKPRSSSSSGLGRLLGLADGLLGQGYNTLILFTTNEEIGRVHPALIRPGRCLARVEFTKFSPQESSD